jgi:hypothetical protein
MRTELLRLLAGFLGVASFYICFDTIRMLPSSEEGSGNIIRGLIAFGIGFCCIVGAV